MRSMQWLAWSHGDRPKDGIDLDASRRITLYARLEASRLSHLSIQCIFFSTAVDVLIPSLHIIFVSLQTSVFLNLHIF